MFPIWTTKVAPPPYNVLTVSVHLGSLGITHDDGWQSFQASTQRRDPSLRRLSRRLLLTPGLQIGVITSR
jgi:hypothetical protein